MTGEARRPTVQPGARVEALPAEQVSEFHNAFKGIVRELRNEAAAENNQCLLVVATEFLKYRDLDFAGLQDGGDTK